MRQLEAVTVTAPQDPSVGMCPITQRVVFDPHIPIDGEADEEILFDGIIRTFNELYDDTVHLEPEYSMFETVPERILRYFVGKHTHLFEYIWKRNDSPLDEEWDAVLQAWQEQYRGPLSEPAQMALHAVAQVHDYSTEIREQREDYNYALDDLNFDADRERRYSRR